MDKDLQELLEKSVVGPKFEGDHQPQNRLLGRNAAARLKKVRWNRWKFVKIAQNPIKIAIFPVRTRKNQRIRLVQPSSNRAHRWAQTRFGIPSNEINSRSIGSLSSKWSGCTAEILPGSRKFKKFHKNPGFFRLDESLTLQKTFIRVEWCEKSEKRRWSTRFCIMRNRWAKPRKSMGKSRIFVKKFKFLRFLTLKSWFLEQKWAKKDKNWPICTQNGEILPKILEIDIFNAKTR